MDKIINILGFAINATAIIFWITFFVNMNSKSFHSWFITSLWIMTFLSIGWWIYG